MNDIPYGDYFHVEARLLAEFLVSYLAGAATWLTEIYHSTGALGCFSIGWQRNTQLCGSGFC